MERARRSRTSDEPPNDGPRSARRAAEREAISGACREVEVDGVTTQFTRTRDRDGYALSTLSTSFEPKRRRRASYALPQYAPNLSGLARRRGRRARGLDPQDNPRLNCLLDRVFYQNARGERPPDCEIRLRPEDHWSIAPDRPNSRRPRHGGRSVAQSGNAASRKRTAHSRLELLTRPGSPHPWGTSHDARERGAREWDQNFAVEI